MSVRRAVLIGVSVIAVWIAADNVVRRRVHSRNMVRAGQFKQEFDAHTTAGMTLAAVERYLQTKPVKVQRSLRSVDGRSDVEKLMIEVATERSIHWYCGKDSVGIFAEFDRERLTRSYVNWWSFDCL